MNELLYALWFFVPAGAANVTPILVVRLPLLRQWTAPLDGGQRFQGQRLLGGSKTWRGLVCGIIVALLIFALQQQLSDHLGSFSAYLRAQHYADLSIVLGALLGAGALVGDAVESFFKRRVGVAPGSTWFPFDQLDYIIGGCLFAALLVRLSFKMYVLVAIVWFIIHLISSYIGHRLNLKKSPI